MKYTFVLILLGFICISSLSAETNVSTNQIVQQTKMRPPGYYSMSFHGDQRLDALGTMSYDWYKNIPYWGSCNLDFDLNQKIGAIIEITYKSNLRENLFLLLKH